MTWSISAIYTWLDITETLTICKLCRLRNVALKRFITWQTHDAAVSLEASPAVLEVTVMAASEHLLDEATTDALSVAVQ